jgi:hypothetical protein
MSTYNLKSHSINRVKVSEIQTGTIPERVDIKALSVLISELNIARRNFRSYPNGHPAIETAFNKVINLYNQLLALNSPVNIGVGKDCLIVDDQPLDKRNLVFQDFAKILYERGIIALTLDQGLNSIELRNFNIILSLKRENITSHGGINAIWEKSGIRSIKIVPVQYDLFSSTEVDSVSAGNQQVKSITLWEAFSRSIINGTKLNQVNEGIDDEVAPETLANILNRQLSSIEQIDNIPFAESFRIADRQFSPLTSGNSGPNSVSYDNLALFVNKLHPELRRRFLSSSFDLNSLSQSTLAEEVISRISDDTIIEAMEDVKQDRVNLPTAILKLIERMSSQAFERIRIEECRRRENQDLNQKIKDIFCEHEAEDFTPESYQQLLDTISSSNITYNFESAVTDKITATLDGHQCENHLSEIILRMLIIDGAEVNSDHLVSSLGETYFYLLQTGDYEQLLSLLEQCDQPSIPLEIRDKLRLNYTTRESLEEILTGLTTWGKSKYDIINRLINRIGEPFIEVLLDHLAIEENLSLRRFIMDRLQDFGPLARNALISRLSDNRWFVIRNLIIILRYLNDPSIVEQLRNLIHHPNHRVRQEALRTCLYFQDPAAERQILYDMSSNDRETQLAAISLADKSRSIDVFKKLISIVSRPGFNSIECELKSAVILSLGEIGRPEALPELAKLLSSSSLLNYKQLAKLKCEAIRSLAKYPAEISRPILAKLITGGGETSKQAEETLKHLREKTL